MISSMPCVGESCRVIEPPGKVPHPDTAPSCSYDRQWGDGEWPNQGDCGHYSGGPRTVGVVDAPFVTSEGHHYPFGV